MPNIMVTRTAPATALVDGDNGMGHLVMSRATDEAIAIAREQGVGFVGVRRSNHAGPAGLYAEMPAAAGMIGIYAAVANANHMATWGGADHLLGTNPLAIGVPSGNGALVFDMATSIVAYGTVKKYALRGLTMPEGWFVNPDTGAAITDPNRSNEGMLLPMGEYKGSGLALMIGIDCRRAQRRRLRPRRRRLQCRRQERNQYRTFPHRRRYRALSCRSRRSLPRSIAMCATCGSRSACPVSMRSVCPATAAPNAAANGCATACRSRRPLIAQLDKMARELKVKPLAER